jgi:hypothetical protein
VRRRRRYVDLEHRIQDWSQEQYHILVAFLPLQGLRMRGLSLGSLGSKDFKIGFPDLIVLNFRKVSLLFLPEGQSAETELIDR